MAKKRIWGWFFFDWASQPYHTVLLTFIFGPYFVSIAQGAFEANGASAEIAKADAQGLWSLGLTVTGLFIGLAAPFLGALADTSSRRWVWMLLFSAMCICGASGIWWVLPDGSNLTWALITFGLGFIGVEFALIFTNGQLPALGNKQEVGQISGSGFAFGYLGGVIALLIALLFFVEQSTGKTIAEISPLFGLDPIAREGTRFVGPLTALWFVVFIIPYFLWVRDKPTAGETASLAQATRSVARAVLSLRHQPSLAAYLGSSMVYRDALNALYGFGGTYAALVLGWETTQIGVFGIVSAIAAAGFSFVGGRLDRRFGPKPVIAVSISGLILVCLVIVSMTPQSVAGLRLPDGSTLPNTIFLICGILIGGLGGVLQAASRSLMVRHSDPVKPTESFGLYGLSGRATAFLGPMLIGIVTVATDSVRLGITPLIGLFILGLILLVWVQADGDRAGI